jgi:hypothetical protein
MDAGASKDNGRPWFEVTISFEAISRADAHRVLDMIEPACRGRRWRRPRSASSRSWPRGPSRSKWPRLAPPQCWARTDNDTAPRPDEAPCTSVSRWRCLPLLALSHRGRPEHRPTAPAPGGCSCYRSRPARRAHQGVAYFGWVPGRAHASGTRPPAPPLRRAEQPAACALPMWLGRPVGERAARRRKATGPTVTQPELP